MVNLKVCKKKYLSWASLVMPISDPRDRSFYPHHTPMKDTYILTYETEFVSIFSGTGKFCLAHGLRQLTRDTKSDVSCLQTFFTRRNEKRRMRFGVGRHTTLIVNFSLSIFDFSEKM